MTWATAIEQENDYFQVLHSTDGVKFAEIASVEGAGTTEFQTDYYHYDFDPLPGINYYRLAQYVFDGSSELLPIIAVEYTPFSQPLEVNMYPNPAEYWELALDIKTENLAQNIELIISDLSGRMVHSEQITPTALQFNYRPQLANIQRGAYLVRLTQADQIIVVKRLIIK